MVKRQAASLYLKLNTRVPSETGLTANISPDRESNGCDYMPKTTIIKLIES